METRNLVELLGFWRLFLLEFIILVIIFGNVIKETGKHAINQCL